MADHSVLSGGASSPVRRDELDPEVEGVDAISGQSGDGQGRRYAHTLRRGGATSTPPSGVSTVAMVQAGERDVSTIAMPKLPPADPRDSAKLAAPRLPADARDSAKLAAPRLSPADLRDSAKFAAPRLSPADLRDAAKLAAPRLAADARDSARFAVPRLAADPRDSAKLAVPRLLPDDDSHDSTNVTMPKLSTDARDSAQMGLPRPEVDDLGDSAQMGLPEPEVDDPGDSVQMALPRPEVGSPLDSSKITMPKAAIDHPRDSGRIALVKPPRAGTAPPVGPSGPGIANPARAPSDSTALYRKRNTRPTLPTVQADGTPHRESSSDDAPSAILVDEISIPEPIGADAPSRLPSVVMDADPGRMALLRVPGLPSLPSLPSLPRLSRIRVVLPLAVAAVVAIAVWLLRSMH